ncbi:TROVE domain-containing protein [Fibrella aquatilis]|uniref:TROVE domain-containing protein n=1 Tax=Fibrella aquatilis TaxID=2817059 RepID=A0A939G4L4_9BACT|nr:TROVE domain-containing protein [Fibrella aquatilis]MBO0930137.1 TROVE domain-containing protein [Fibrella aquatilis]
MRFNTTNTADHADATTLNHMGAKAYTLSAEMELYTAVTTTMLADSYYQKADDRLALIQLLVGEVDPLFVARLAVYAREAMYLRSVPLVLVGELARIHNGDDLVSRTIARVVQRPDEISELLAYYQLANARTGAKKLNRLSKQLQKGLALAFNRFDAYQFAKYERKTAVQLRDALFLVHPKAKDEAQQAIFDQLASRTLSTPYTWETELSALGQQAFGSEKEKQLAVRTKWHELIDSHKLGYMAMLRNLRNMLEANIDMAHIDKVCALITHERAVQQAKQLPFRYLSAYAELKAVATQKSVFYLFGNAQWAVKKLIQALEKALVQSVAYLPIAAGKTLILSDNSGSMFGDVGGRSAVSAMSRRTTADIANLFAVLYWTRAESTLLGLFGERLITPQLSRSATLFNNFDRISREAGKCGGATEEGIFVMLEKLIKSREIVDRIVIFSDCQIGRSCNWYGQRGRRADDFDKLFAQYRTINPEVKTFSVDLKGYGNTMATDGIYTISGWSDKLFALIVAAENGQTALDAIDAVAL